MDISTVQKILQDFSRTESVSRVVDALNDFFSRFPESSLETESQLVSIIWSAFFLNGIKPDVLARKNGGILRLVINTYYSVFVTAIGIDVPSSSLMKKLEDLNSEENYPEETKNLSLVALTFSSGRKQIKEWMQNTFLK